MLYLTMSGGVHCHIDPEDLERYAMGRASEEELARYEEHLLLCEMCRSALLETDSHVAAMRIAAAGIRREPVWRPRRWQFPTWVPAAAALVLVLVGVRFFRWRGTAEIPLAVSLTTTRGVGLEASAPAGRALALTPDLTALSPESFYRLEIVDAQGKKTWEGRYTPADGPAHARAQDSGTHFVRVYSPSGELLREYGLEIKR
jgi:anti-sigma factor RsiW